MGKLKRRQFLKAAASATCVAALGGLAGCSSQDGGKNTGKGQGSKDGKAEKHRGEGRPKFTGAMNRAIKVDSAPSEDEALAKFVVVSDTHIDLSYQPYVDRVEGMFKDIKNFCPDVDKIVVNGDITNHGEKEEYAKFKELAEAAGFAYPDDFILVIGNHDQYDSTEGAEPISNLTDEFRKQAGIDDQFMPYYDETINGVHLIMMGPDRYPEGNWAHFGISEEQVAWLDKLVMADLEQSVLDLVFIHEPLYETVRNTQPGDFGHEWSLSEEDNDNLHDRIKKYPNIVYFSGHTHALPDTVQIEKEGPLFVGTGSIAYCLDDWDDDSTGNADISEYGSLGFEVTVWTTHIRFRMRNFLTGEYIDNIVSAIYRF